MKNALLIKLLLACMSLLLVFSVHGKTDAGRLNQLLSGITTLEATFKQVLLDEDAKPIQKSSGIFQLQRPGKFRWDYTKPFEQLIVADGRKLWIYDADLEQVTVRKQDSALGNTPALLLTTDRAVEKDFNVQSKGVQEGLEWFELTPRDKESNFMKINLGFGQNKLQVMELIDGFGQTTRLDFDSIVINTHIATKQFEFKPPRGVDIIKD
ncbi:MAG: outer membrane lipoprotein chaperone LolA [Gammaproteobacteria bacterium]|nr:outer membrane lipoprotein chaperone LolA [Gammaproteobacteria bacterium]